jgi:hypothetical protein
MNIEELKKDAEYAHAIFDLCGIPRKTRGTGQRSLRIRASLLAEMVGIRFTIEQLEAQRQKASGSN